MKKVIVILLSFLLLVSNAYADSKECNDYAYYIIYETNGGVAINKSIVSSYKRNYCSSSVTYVTGESSCDELSSRYNLPIPEKEGFSFDGWYYDKELTNKCIADNINDVITNKTTNFKDECPTYHNITLYAKWTNKHTCEKEKTYKIIYQTNGGEKLDSDIVLSTIKASNSKLLPTTTREGYKFSGWYYDEKFKNKVSKDKIGYVKTSTYTSALGCKEYNDVTLYAKWTLIKEKEQKKCIAQTGFSIIYETNGGNKLENDLVNFSIDAEMTHVLPTPTKEGYKFGGWYYDFSFKKSVNASYIGNINTTKTSDSKGCTAYNNVVLYAKWIANSSDIVNSEINPFENIAYFDNGAYLTEYVNSSSNEIMSFIIDSVSFNSEINKLIDKKVNNYLVYNLKLYNNMSEVDMSYDIPFVLDKEMNNKNIVIYRVGDKLEQYDYKIKDNIIVISTNLLGTYVIGEKKDYTTIIGLGIATIIILVILIISAIRQSEKENKLLNK